ncbi:MAG: hypothetical protein KGD59_02050 [Candidatus Heimdallarchaeota archaeon]|nr:hypothetical protein [Candidatus Heimdallarchaeota archaeon]MBY8993303.1 hypothetical protein [Candidatus Heimdallarchaeota archaeon]
MKKKSLVTIITSIFCILLTINIFSVSGVDLSLVDETQDVVHMVDGITQGSGLAVYPEIDIVSLEMNDSFIALTFLGTPVLHIDNFYDFIVYWNGDQNTNFTDGHWNQGNIISQTKLVNSTGGIIVNTLINDTIDMISNTIYYPIYNASLISTDLDPINMIADARLRILGADFYRDVLEYNTGDTAPGYTYLIAVAGLTTLVIMVILRKKKY